MTELAPLHTHADLQLASAPVSAPFVPSRLTTNRYSPPAEQIIEDEDNSIIRCFCGISDDDGNTVLCEICNTWQHILCYYPAGNETVPDEHVCVDCRPRPHDKKGAWERQQNARALVSPQERKIKKPPAKTHKKKIKDGNSASIQTNGWLSGTDAPDRASGSPRENGPPTKRPKTTHRSSASTSNFGLGHSRKRAGSTTLNGQSPTKSPRSNSPEGYTGDFYTPEFMRASCAPWQTVQDNTYASITASNSLRTWLQEPEIAHVQFPGISQTNVFMRWDRPMEALVQQSPGYTPCQREDSSMLINGAHPVHKWVEVSKTCGKDAFIGELHGMIGKTEDYHADPNNRWNELRHPEPFVFFHDKLPIYIDCRDEGNHLRYVGRSCQPNVKLQIIIHGFDFHFCFVSLREIQEGEQLTVPWYVRDRELELVGAINSGANISPAEEAHLCSFFTNILANFGGCACQRHEGPPCSLARFDLRNKERPYATANTKATKPRKPKRLPTQISPGSTGRATNSRAGSEAVQHGENDEEMVDSRSLSAKSRSQPSSRDITPLLDAPVGLGVGMSDRERRKILQQEKLFEKMELDGQAGAKKGKRNSAGSALNTPAPTSSVRRPDVMNAHIVNANMKQKQLGFPDNISPTTSANPRARTNGSTPRPVNDTKVQRSKPQMVSTPMQTDNDVSMASPSPPRRRRNGSHISCLLRRVQTESKRRRERSASTVSSQGKASPPCAPVVATKLEGTPSPVMTSMPPPPLPNTLSNAQPKPDPLLAIAAANIEPKDVEMQDAPAESAEPTTTSVGPKNESVQPPTEATCTVVQTDPPVPSDKPPSPFSSTADSPASLRPTHVTLPPVPSFPSTEAPSTTTPSITTPSEVVQSPPQLTPSISNAPLLSPNMSHASISAPSPAKKKMSLGDWMRQKKEREAVAKQAKEMEVKSDPIEEDKDGNDDGDKADAEAAVEDVDMPLAPATESADQEEGKDKANVDPLAEVDNPAEPKVDGGEPQDVKQELLPDGKEAEKPAEATSSTEATTSSAAPS